LTPLSIYAIILTLEVPSSPWELSGCSRLKWYSPPAGERHPLSFSGRVVLRRPLETRPRHLVILAPRCPGGFMSSPSIIQFPDRSRGHAPRTSTKHIAPQARTICLVLAWSGYRLWWSVALAILVWLTHLLHKSSPWISAMLTWAWSTSLRSPPRESTLPGYGRVKGGAYPRLHARNAWHGTKS